MNNEILFQESQKFRQWWVWLVLLGINGLFLFRIYKQLVIGQPFGNKPTSNQDLMIAEGLILLITIWFLYLRLDTQIKKDGVYVRFFPFHFSYRYYPWERISKSFVRQYNPITEYGGWGLRLGIFGRGKAYNVSGNEGLQLEFSNHKKLLIGTHKPIELAETLVRIGQLRQ